jgi:hypothetical protein
MRAEWGVHVRTRDGHGVLCRSLLRVGAVLLVVGMAVPLAQAEDIKGKWYFGGNLSFLSTTDYIRSNSAIIIGPLGDDGIPFTGDPNEASGCATGISSTTIFCDPRPDDLLARETTIEETFRIELTAGFGLTSWLSLQLDTSYFQGDISPVDVFTRDVIMIDPDGQPPFEPKRFKDREISTPINGGEITEIPVTLSAIMRFRKDSPLNPYINLGVGRIFTDVNASEDVSDLNSRLNALRIRGITDEFGKDIVDPADAPLRADGRIPMEHPLTVEVEDAWEWHVGAGLEWFQSERFSLVFDAKYSFANSDVNLSLGGPDQVDFTIFSEEFFRSDGSLKIFSSRPAAPNTPCSQAGRGPNGEYAKNCEPGTPPTNYVDPDGPGDTCSPSIGDFDYDGHNDDLCYNAGAPNIASNRGVNRPDGLVLVQGGHIDMTGLSVAIGVRWHF